MDALPILTLVTITFVVAGVVKGVIGLGLPTVAMGVLGSLMTPAEAAAYLVVPSLVTNVWQLLAGPSFGRLLRRLAGMMAGVVVGTLVGSGLMAGGDTRLATAGLGLALAIYGITGLAELKLRVAPRHEPWAGPLVGLVTGLVTGATGVFVIPAGPYLGGLGLDRDDLIQALGLSFTVSTLALALGLAVRGALPAAALVPSLLALIPALAGMWLGGVLRRRLAPATFRRVFMIGMLALGCEIAIRSLARF